MARLAVIADDLTGANDTAVQFAKRGISTCVQIDFDQEHLDRQDTDVIVLNTDSRDMQKEDAYAAVQKAAELLKAQHVEHIYKKVDSTLRGNFGAEIAAVDDVFHPPLVVIAPAFPKNHRLTIGGYHFLNGLPIEMTEIAHAPKTPVHDSFIARLIEKQTGHTAGLISMVTLKQGVEEMKQKIRKYLEKGQRWIVFDVAQEEHFDLILQSVAEYENVLWVGSAGLANYLPGLYHWSSRHKGVQTAAAGATLIAAGSVSHTTQAQVMELLKQPDVERIRLDVEAFLHDEAAELQRCCQAAQCAIREQKDVLLVSGATDQDVARAVKAGAACGLKRNEVSERTACFMSKVICGLDMTGLAGMVLTGGDIAVHVLRELQAENIEIVSEVAAGIPLGRLRGGRCSGMKVVTKAGAFGDKDCFVQALNVIRREDGGGI